MIEILQTFWTSFYDLSNDMAVYILVGLLFAGILHELIPSSFVAKHLGRGNVASVVKSTLFGVPLPVCSCGVIPLATAIKKSGASNGATLSFLISTPITGVDSILATFGMFGWAFALYRVVTSMIIAIIAGILDNLLVPATPSFSTAAAQGFSPKPAAAVPAVSFAAAPQNGQSEPQSCCSGTDSCTTQKKGFSLSAALTYGFVTLLGDIAKPLFWGLVIGAAITAAVPEDLSSWLGDAPWLSYLIVVAIAVPMYVCATASLPIAASLILSGIAPGAAFVFLSAGPATNTVTIGVVKKMLGTKSLMIYLGTIVAGSLLFGILMDMMFDAADIDIRELIAHHEEAGMLQLLSSAVMWAFLLYFLLKPYIKRNADDTCCTA